jgi:DNA excision repair protein ERCC-3
LLPSPAPVHDRVYVRAQVYDSASDRDTAALRIGLRSNSVLRPYQERCLAKFFAGAQANSGIIVLPCGAGKTLVGVTAAATLKKSTLVVCSSAVAVTQWKQQFLQWTTLPESDISAFTSGSREGSRAVTITTYHMIGHREKRGRWSKRGVESIASRQWGLVILDEVHMFPSAMFSTVMRGLRVHCKLGLTATLVREDSRIDALKDLIGPKLLVGMLCKYARRAAFATRSSRYWILQSHTLLHVRGQLGRPCRSRFSCPSPLC